MNYFLVLLLVAAAAAAPSGDLVTNLPGLNFAINFNQYSGYLDGDTGKHLHYWFVESQNDPANDPLVLWLNGGPGCSSLDGFLTENGPFRVLDDSSALIENPYSWNKVANMIFLESPACVGFSYSDTSSCATGDDDVALNNYLAIQDFFSKFPEYSGNEFYVTGESYGGVYVPTLSVLIQDGLNDFPINFQGYATGNGILNDEVNTNSLIFYAYYHALLDQDLWDNLVTRCCGGVEGQDTCQFAGTVSAQCEASVVVALDIIYGQGLNIYDLYADCEAYGPVSDNRQSKSRAYYDILNVVKSKHIRGRPVPISTVPCINSYPVATWLNQPDVRTAIHIPSTVQDWEICSDPVFNNYDSEYGTVAPQIQYLQGKVRALIYNGDCDMACNVLGNEWVVTSLGFTETEPRNRWMWSGDVAGYNTRYEYLDFVTVRGAGHMVPTDRPGQALSMFTSFLNNESY